MKKTVITISFFVTFFMFNANAITKDIMSVSDDNKIINKQVISKELHSIEKLILKENRATIVKSISAENFGCTITLVVNGYTFTVSGETCEEVWPQIWELYDMFK